MSVVSSRAFQRLDPAFRAGLPAASPSTAPATLPFDNDRAFAMALLRDGVVAPHILLKGLAQIGDGTGRLVDTLLNSGTTAPERIYGEMSRHFGVGLADLRRTRPDPRLIDALGAGFCLSNLILPWRDSGGVTVIVTAYPETFSQHAETLAAAFGPVVHALAPPDRITHAILAVRGPQLAQAAETMVPAAESCRNFKRAAAAQWVLIGLCTMLALFTAKFTLTLLLLWAVFTLAFTATMKTAALISTLKRPDRTAPPPPIHIARLPTVSVMVALYKESDIAARLVRRLGRLDYPRDLLDIVLVVEEEDHMTRKALRRADLPPWMRVVLVPHGRVKTKPRALNFGLTQCRGSIIGVYDAEDAPEPDQIRKVVERFHQRGPKVACLQGVLDFYNPHNNWLARCFTIEYAGWFRVMLPGLQNLGLPLPLGGTTLFFRRAALEALGGWDSHNVTEDADLGMRLVRHGYRTETIATTTFEEANCAAIPWVKQRSRWVKGYMMTYITHMRDPVALWRQLGARAFLGFQVLFLGSITQALLAPLIWSMLVLHFGFDHPVASVLSHDSIRAISALFILAEILNIALGVVGLRRTGHKMSPLWVPTLAFYFPLQALAAYKAAWEMLRKPFYWDKTSHGSFSSQQA